MSESFEPEIKLLDLAGQEIPVNFVQSPDFRVIYCEGAWGGITPRGLIQMAIFTERMPLPDTVKHVIQEDGGLTPVEEKRPPAMERIIEADLIMPMDVAISVRDWLTIKITQAQALQAKIQGQTNRPEAENDG